MMHHFNLPPFLASRNQNMRRCVLFASFSLASLLSICTTTVSASPFAGWLVSHYFLLLLLSPKRQQTSIFFHVASSPAVFCLQYSLFILTYLPLAAEQILPHPLSSDNGPARFPPIPPNSLLQMSYHPQKMEYQPNSTPSYPPQPSRPGPSPLGNGAANAPALYATAPGGGPGAGGSANGYYSAAAVALPTGGGRLYSDNVVQQLPPRISGGDTSIKSARTTCEFAAREYLTQLRKMPGGSSSYSANDPMAMDAVARARAQQGLVLDELQTLRRSLAVVIKEAEAHRWRKWMLGGML